MLLSGGVLDGAALRSPGGDAAVQLRGGAVALAFRQAKATCAREIA